MEIIFNAVGKNGKNDASDVKKIQNLLNASSAVTTIVADGRYGPATLKAIIQYQMSIFLQENACDGLISANGNTLRALNNAKTPIMRKVTLAMADMQANRLGASPSPAKSAHADVLVVRTELKTVTSAYKGLSGERWCGQFPTSINTDDLRSPFKENFKKFESALSAAGLDFKIEATFRPSQRAWLMHTAYMIAHAKLNPEKIPPLAGVNIDWVHRDAKGNCDITASKAAAAAMNRGYHTKYKPSITSLHISGNAVDATFSWSKSFSIIDGNNKTVKVPAGSSIDSKILHEVAETYGVRKKTNDHPHWSINGN